MVHFLELPYEIRAQILGYVLQYVKKSPTEIETEQRVGATRPGQFAIVPSKTPLIDLRPILQINKQIYSEAQAVMMPHDPTQYHLDLIMIRYGEYLIPEWTYISRPSRFIDTLVCNVRLHGEFEYVGGRLVHFNDIRWQLMRLLHGFCFNGPRLNSKEDRKATCRHYVRRLVVDVKSATTDRLVQQGSQHVSVLSRPYPDQPSIRRVAPGYMLRILTDLMEYFVSCDYHTGDYGSIMYTSFGHIEFRSDGETIKVVDLDAKLVSALERPFPTPNDPARGQAPYILRIYHTVQMWVPLIQRLRMDTGLTEHAETKSMNRIKAEIEKSRPYYKSWATCLNEVLKNRPETR